MPGKNTDKVKQHKKLLRRTTALGTAVGLYFAAPYIDMATESYDLSPMPDCASHSSVIDAEPNGESEIREEAVDKMFSDPASIPSVAIQGILQKGSSGPRLEGMMHHQKDTIVIHPQRSPESSDYMNSCETRSSLTDIEIYNPLLLEEGNIGKDSQDPADFIEFKALANFSDAPSGNRAVAYYQPDTETLVIGVVGMKHNENYDRPLAVIADNVDRVVPFEFAQKFLDEISTQLRDQKLPVSQTSIITHSLGTPGGITIKGMIETSHAKQVVFGKEPALTMVEGFGEGFAAEAVEDRLGVSHDRLTRNSVTIRTGGDGDSSIPGTEWGFNQTIGKEVYSIDVAEGHNQHDLGRLVKGILNGDHNLQPYDGEFTRGNVDMLKGEGAELLGKLAKLGRNVREGLSIG